MLQWEVGYTLISMFSFRYSLSENVDTCESDGLRLIATSCNSTALMVSFTSQQIVVTYWVVNQVTPLQQLIFPSQFSSGLINITISGSSINIFTIPSYEVGGSKVYNGMLENMHECVGFVDRWH
jgi:hypothetical protein